MTTTTIARGSEWGIFGNFGVYANWGDIDPENGRRPDYNASYKKLGDAVVEKFHDIACENRSSARWIPETSEVISDIDDPNFPIDEWREAATEEIWDLWCNGEIEPVWANDEYEE
jgi:hypothetical protein